jgi:hypothetical protein
MTKERVQMEKRKYRPNSFSCEGCPEWDDVNGCWSDQVDIRECRFMDETLTYNDDLYDEMEFSVDEEEPVLPVTLQLIKDEFDRTADNSRCNPDPNYDLENYLKDVGLPSDTTPADEVLVIDCPHCGRASFYNGGFTASCSCCGYYNLADHSDEAYTLADYWCRKDEVPF